MARRKAIKRLVIGPPFIIAYVVAIYPASLLIGVALAIPQIAYAILTDCEIELKAEISSRVWRYGSDNVDWILSGRGQFQLLP